MWAEKLQVYASLNWKNISWHCPKLHCKPSSQPISEDERTLVVKKMFHFPFGGHYLVNV